VEGGAKHPRLAAAPNGDVLITWVEDTGWNRGGNLVWALVNEKGVVRASEKINKGIPVWSFSSVVRSEDGAYFIFY